MLNNESATRDGEVLDFTRNGLGGAPDDRTHSWCAYIRGKAVSSSMSERFLSRASAFKQAMLLSTTIEAEFRGGKRPEICFPPPIVAWLQCFRAVVVRATSDSTHMALRDTPIVKTCGRGKPEMVRESYNAIITQAIRVTPHDRRRYTRNPETGRAALGEKRKIKEAVRDKRGQKGEGGSREYTGEKEGLSVIATTRVGRLPHEDAILVQPWDGFASPQKCHKNYTSTHRTNISRSPSLTCDELLPENDVHHAHHGE